MTATGSGERAPTAREWDAAAYHRVSEPQLAWGRRVLERLPLEGGETVLDAGCGSGRLTALLAERLPAGRVLAVDRSVAMARTAARTLAALPAQVVAADLLALPLAGGCADAVLSTATFHWVRDHDALFAGLRRVLRPGGRLVAQCGGGANIAAVHGFALETAAEGGFGAAFEGWEEPWLYAWPEQTEARLRAAGFVEARAWLEEAPTVLEDRATCAAFLETVILRPWLVRLGSAEDRARFTGLVVDRLAGTDPPWLLDYWRLNIEAA